MPYFGTYGPWFPLYLHSLAQQRVLDLLLVTDAKPPPLPSNARLVPMTLNGLRGRAASKLGRDVRLPRVRKLCDLKPAYGLVFEEFTRGYRYWAFGDEDVLYGDLDRLLGPLVQDEPDLVIPSRTMTIGHLTLIRNAPRTNELAVRDPTYARVLASDDYWAYDESGWARPEAPGSFTRAVQDAEARGELNAVWGFNKRGSVPWHGRSYVYDGTSIHDNDGTPIVYYHWGRFRRLDHRYPTAEEAAAGFAFDRYGFYRLDLGPARSAARRATGYGRELVRAVRQRAAQMHFPIPGF